MAEDDGDYDDDDAPGPVGPEEVPEPRANPYLSGHEAAEASLSVFMPCGARNSMP